MVGEGGVLLSAMEHREAFGFDMCVTGHAGSSEWNCARWYSVRILMHT